MPDSDIILRENAARYPLMTPCDAVKLLYQSEFGGGHIVENEKASLEYLTAEYSAALRDTAPLSEDIGGGYARLYLHPAQRPYAECINRIFVLSSKRGGGSIEAFEARLNLLRAACGDGVFSFDEDELDSYLSSYRDSGYPPVSHSEAYRAAYRPAYRVIDARYVRLLPVLFAIYDLMRSKPDPVILIDGRAASGKTTAAELIAPVVGAELVHMDDFFLPPELRTPERYAEVGGNVHYERFRDEVIRGIEGGSGFSYRVFDCGELDYTATHTISPHRPIIIEGAYCMHPYLNHGDLRVFSDISPEAQMSRILARNGAEMWQRFKREWIPMEEKYFKSYSIKEHCDIVI